jgi:hypothetical protein
MTRRLRLETIASDGASAGAQKRSLRSPRRGHQAGGDAGVRQGGARPLARMEESGRRPSRPSPRKPPPDSIRRASTNGFVPGSSTGRRPPACIAASRSFPKRCGPPSRTGSSGALSSALSCRMDGSAGSRRPSGAGAPPERTPMKLITDCGVSSRRHDQLLERDCPHCGGWFGILRAPIPTISKSG